MTGYQERNSKEPIGKFWNHKNVQQGNHQRKDQKCINNNKKLLGNGKNFPIFNNHKKIGKKQKKYHGPE